MLTVRWACVVATGCLCAPAGAQVTELESVSSGGIQGSSVSFGGSVSSDGRYSAFTSFSMNLVPNDTNGTWDVFVRDRVLGTTECVSVDSTSTPGNSDSHGGAMSADGRFVLFHSNASNLVPGDTNGASDVFVRDRVTGSTELVSVNMAGQVGNFLSTGEWISLDGRYVVFDSWSFDLVPGDTNMVPDVFVRDRLTGTTERVNLSSAGSQANDGSAGGGISGDGRYVAFQSGASNLVAGDTNGWTDVFVHDRQTGATVRVNLSSTGQQANSNSGGRSISVDGRFVGFSSSATNLVPGDGNGASDVFVRDLLSGTTELVSRSSAGVQGDAASDGGLLSADGRFVTYQSLASNLAAGDTNGLTDVFLYDRLGSTTERVSIRSDGSQSNGISNYGECTPDGRYVVFTSYGTNLVQGDSNGNPDAFLRDRAASGFTSTCDAGAGGVIPCPCGNPPSGAGRGCDNSSATGGASISASGAAYLALDSLVFTTGGEKPIATSLLLEGDALLPNGAVFGQGVRCAGGALRRLYVKTAVNGSITAPDFSVGDPTVSARSAALGAPLQPGHPYTYFVYYRDPLVLGGCSAASTFNATQTASIAWWP